MKSDLDHKPGDSALDDAVVTIQVLANRIHQLEAERDRLREDVANLEAEKEGRDKRQKQYRVWFKNDLEPKNVPELWLDHTPRSVQRVESREIGPWHLDTSVVAQHIRKSCESN